MTRPIGRATVRGAIATAPVIAAAIIRAGARAIGKTVFRAVIINIAEAVTGAMSWAVSVTGLPTLAILASIWSAAAYRTADIGNVFNGANFIDHSSKFDRNSRCHCLRACHHKKPGQRG